MSQSYQSQYAEVTRNLLNYPKKIGNSRIGKINSLFSQQIRIDLTKEFPLMDIKKIKFLNIVHELLWMIRGNTNIKYLIENGCNIWTDDAYRYYKEKYSPYRHLPHEPQTSQTKLPIDINKKEFVDLVKKNRTFEFQDYDPITFHPFTNKYKFGNLDKIYGYQWRRHNGKTDQLQKCIDMLKINPDDRRMIVDAHNPTDIEEKNVGLPSCHNYFQFYTTEIEKTLEEEIKGFKIKEDETITLEIDANPKLTRKLSIFVNIRSNDWFLGNPYNVAQYALLTHMVAEVVNMKVDELVINSVDAHLYHIHFNAANEWLDRYDDLAIMDTYCSAKINLSSLDSIDDFIADDIELYNYNPQKFIKAQLLT